MRERRIAVITALPPSRTTLSEYGYHLVRALAARPEVAEVVALVEHLPADERYPVVPGVRILPCWRFGNVGNAPRIARALRRVDADVAIFNIQFSSFGDGRVAAAVGLVSPLLARLGGTPTITLLHNIVEAVDLGNAGFRFGPIAERVMRGIGTILTWLLLRSHLVAVTMPRYVELLRAKYRAVNVVLVPHGTFELPPEPAFDLRPGTHRILAFGKFGTYKRVETLIAAYERLAGERDVELVIAGGDSPNAPGYLADVERRLGGPGIHFTGYVDEGEVPALFRSAAVAVFPYSATTGSSGVLHQAAAYGCPAVVPRVGDFPETLDVEGYAAELFEPDDTAGLEAAIARMIDLPERRRRFARQSYRAASGFSMDDVATLYLLHSDLIEAGAGR